MKDDAASSNSNEESPAVHSSRRMSRALENVHKLRLLQSRQELENASLMQSKQAEQQSMMESLSQWFGVGSGTLDADKIVKKDSDLNWDGDSKFVLNGDTTGDALFVFVCGRDAPVEECMQQCECLGGFFVEIQPFVRPFFVPLFCVGGVMGLLLLIVWGHGVTLGKADSMKLALPSCGNFKAMCRRRRAFAANQANQGRSNAPGVIRNPYEVPSESSALCPAPAFMHQQAQPQPTYHQQQQQQPLLNSGNSGASSSSTTQPQSQFFAAAPVPAYMTPQPHQQA